jgi:predicted AlkP superfamily pyrophosphatase or phosphodiesterase
MWRPLGDGIKRVVLLIVDSWGWNLFEKVKEDGAPMVGRADLVGKISSIFPSTTSAALSTLWTGLAPAQHGLAGLRLFLPHYAVTTQMLHFTPTFGKYPDALIKAGLDPATFLHGLGFAQQLASAGVEAHAFKGRELIDTALSQMHDRGVAGDHGASSMADMLVQMRILLEEKAGQPLYVCAYWPTVDTLSHIYGWEHESVAAELRAILTQLQTELVDALSLAARKETALFVVSDHGQVVTPARQRIYLEDHPELERLLFMRPAGEPRTVYLYAKQGRQTDVITYIRERLAHAMVPFLSQQALAEGMLGPAPHAPATAERVGDVIATMRQGYVLLTESERKSADKLLGRHGGMSMGEMEVPWLGFRLDG